MWFKNLKLYRLAPKAKLTVTDLEAALNLLAFRPGSSQDNQVSGWMPPRDDSGLVYAQNGQILLRLHVEKKLLPASVVNQASKARAIQIEEQQGYKPGRKQMKEIKEQMTMELLPRAFVIVHDTRVWIDTINRWVAIDAAATASSDEVLGMLARTLAPFPIVPLHVEVAPARAMTQWLCENEAPAGFTIDQNAELCSTGESKATVRYLNQTINQKEAVYRIREGKQCTRLALTWNDRVSFVLTDNLDIKRVAPLDVLKEHQDAQAANEAEQFDSDFTLMTGELAHLLGDLVAALGGIPPTTD
ncbi:recombination-associated protein RdgC [Castellaniella hirudinis]|uniref:recombination-associated protein RdgC n=1 Tax=Castellaniella hirudinis TaxID=1144617 RepID=UPI0039C08AE7